jgi:hypothetical protein
MRPLKINYYRMKNKPMNMIKRFALISLLLVSISSASRAQGNLPYVDGKFIHFGFLLGFNAMDFGINPKDSVAVSDLRPGFSVGIISDLRLNRYLNLRFTPTLDFGQRQLNYRFSGGIKDSASVSSIFICLPVYLKYSAERKDNYRPYLIWGAGMYYDLGQSTANDVRVALKPIDFYTEFGVGCDLYFSFFKLAPELKFAIGFNDVLNHNYNPVDPTNKKYSQALSRLTSRMVTLSFNFE